MVQIRGKYEHERYVWLDQARGIVGLFFIISTITWNYGGDLLRADPMIGPNYLDHGYNYMRSTPQLLTIIDLGQPIFLFFVGLSGYIAFSSRLKKKGVLRAWGYGFQRLFILYLLSTLGMMLEEQRGEEQSWRDYFITFDWYGALCIDVLAVIAAGAFATYLSVQIIRSADVRTWFAVGLFFIHSIVYAIYIVDRPTWSDTLMELPKFPLSTISLAILAIVGSCFGQWIQERRENIPLAMQARVVPIACYCLVASYCMEWLQPSNHHGGTMALMLLGAGLSGLFIAVSYGLHSIGVTLHVLASMGKNLLLVFIVGMVGVEFYLSKLPDWLIYDYPLGAMIFVGFIPLFGVVSLMRFLDKRNIVFRV